MDLLPGTAHIWTLPLDSVARNVEAPVDDRVIDRLEEMLSEGEKKRSRLFAFENNRREYIAAHALCRVMLSAFSKTPPPDWQFETGLHGRPEIAGTVDDESLRFNISHTRGLVCAAVNRDHDIGVDVEWTGRKNSIDEIARAKFSKPEVMRLEELPEAEKRQGFFKFWTLKEAYIKAIGKGLAEPLDGFAFSLDPPGIEFLNGQDDGGDWRFNSFEPAPDYCCALAVRRGGGNEQETDHQVIDIVELSRQARK